MPNISDNSNARIAKNTILLYIRTFIVLLISLYSSRLVLKALGVEDLGIYNVVGGIVALISVIQGAQSKATSRFITFDIGRGAKNSELSKTFSICMTIHILIALLGIVLGETVGLWIVNHWTQIPGERVFAANVVYQFAILTFILHIVRIPLDSIIIAHEEMSIYAFFSIAEAVLKIMLIIAVLYSSADHLILYSAAISFVALCMFLGYWIAVKRRHAGYHFNWIWDKQRSIEVLSFSGWSLTSSTANTLTQQGVGLLFNNFVGLVANAAMGFANQVSAAVSQFVVSFTTAFNPQVVKYCAQEDYDSMHLLMYRASKFSFIMAYILALPVIVNMDFLLEIWLGEVPQYAVEFSQLLLICGVIDATTGVYNTAITATGRIRNYQILISISFLLDLLCSYILLRLELHPALVFGSRILTRGFLNMAIGLHYSKKEVKFKIGDYCFKVLLPILVTIIVSTIPLILICPLTQGWIRLFITVVISTTIIGLSSYFCVMNHHERSYIISMLKNKLNRK